MWSGDCIHKGVLFMVFTLCLAACSKEGSHSLSGKQTHTSTACVERRDLDFVIEVIGDLRPLVQLDVKTEISGKVKKVHMEISQTVKRGDLLVELDDTDLLNEKSSAQTEVDGAKLRVSKAALAAERSQQLVEAEIVSKQEADNLRLDAELARNDLVKAQKTLQTVEDRLSKTRILSPIDGTAIVLPIVDGQVVIGGPSAAQGTLLMTLANLSEMLISTHINQMDVTRMEIGKPVQVTVDAFDGMNLRGKIYFIAPLATVKNNIKGFSVDILVSRVDPRIRPGMSANVRAPIARTTSALAVPVEAVFREDNKTVVYVKNGSNLDRREVSVGIVTADYAEIKSGLKEGDIVSLAHPREGHRTS